MHCPSSWKNDISFSWEGGSFMGLTLKWPPQHVPLWPDSYFELKAIKIWEAHEKLLLLS